MGSRRRSIMPISLSPANPDAVAVTEALKAIPPGQRSAALLAWAAAYLQGRAREPPSVAAAIGISEEELDQLLDAF
jgi:hypothetical protein